MSTPLLFIILAVELFMEGLIKSDWMSEVIRFPFHPLFSITVFEGVSTCQPPPGPLVRQFLPTQSTGPRSPPSPLLVLPPFVYLLWVLLSSLYRAGWSSARPLYNLGLPRTTPDTSLPRRSVCLEDTFLASVPLSRKYFRLSHLLFVLSVRMRGFSPRRNP